MSAQDPWASNITVELGTNGQTQDPAPTPPKEQPVPQNMTNGTANGEAPKANPPAVDQTDKDKGNPESDTEDKSGDKPPEPDRVKLELPPGAEPPTMGFPKLVQRWYEFCQVENPASPGYLRVATPSAKELVLRVRLAQPMATQQPPQKQVQRDAAPVTKPVQGLPTEEPATEPPLPAMIVRARKKAAQKNKKLGFFGHLHRPFDGLRLWFWLMALASTRRMIHLFYRDILVEWEQGLNVFVGNKKGGTGKTPIAILIQLVLAWLTNKAVALLEFNPAGGHAQTRLGIQKTITFRQFLFDNDTSAIDTHEAFTAKVGAHGVFGNAYCISWNDKEHGSENKALTEKPTVKELTRIFRKITAIVHTTVVDQGNPLTGSWYRTAVKYNPTRSVAVIAFQLEQENSESDALLTLQTHIETDPTCADRSVLVITNFVGSWLWWRNRKIRREQIERCAFQFGVPKKRIVIVPRDAAFLTSKEIDPETGEQLPKVLDPRKLRLRTLLAAMRLLVVIARTSREFRENHTATEESQPALFGIEAA